MAYNNSSLAGSSLIWALASLGNSGEGGGGSGTPGKDGNSWIVVNEPLDNGFPAILGSKVGDLILDSTGEIFRVVDDNGNLVVESTGVTLSPTIDQKSLYELYLDLEPKKPLTAAQFHDRFLEALEEHNDFNLYEFYKASGGLKYTTEQEFIDQFIKVMDLDLDALDIETDRIVSKDGSVSIIAENTGVVVDTKTLDIQASNDINIVSEKKVQLTGNEVIIGSTDDLIDGSTHITGVVDPKDDLDAVNKRTLDKAINDVNSNISNLEQKVNDLETENLNLKTQITNLEIKHQEDVDNLQEQIDNLENNLITAITIYLKDHLPDMVKEIVDEYLKDNPGCNCEYPPDIIYGGDAEAQIKELLYIFDNGNAVDNDFDYMMVDYDDPAIEGNEVYRTVDGGDADPSDDEKNTLTFEQWLEMMDLLNVWNGGTAKDKENLQNQYILWMGGNSTSEW